MCISARAGVRRDTQAGGGLPGATQHMGLEMLPGQYHSLIIQTAIFIPKMRDRILKHY